MRKIVKEEWYTSLGQQDFLDGDGFAVTSDPSKAYARILHWENDDITFQIKMNREGKPFNPSQDYEYLTPIEKTTEKSRYKTVNEKAFLFYKLFLIKGGNSNYTEVLRQTA